MKLVQEQDVKRIIIWSDNTASQAKNQFVANALLYSLYKSNSRLENITLYFPEVGHTDLILDMAHSTIDEKVRRSQSISHPDEWKQLIKTCRPKQPFKVRELKREEIINWHYKPKSGNFSSKIPLMKWSEGVSWRFSRGIMYVRANFPSFSARGFSYDFQQLSETYSPPIAYPEPLPISFEKKVELLELIKEARIPIAYLNFYLSLPSKAPPNAQKSQLFDRKVEFLKRRLEISLQRN